MAKAAGAIQGETSRNEASVVEGGLTICLYYSLDMVAIRRKKMNIFAKKRR